MGEIIPKNAGNVGSHGNHLRPSWDDPPSSWHTFFVSQVDFLHTEKNRHVSFLATKSDTASSLLKT